ncbi:MAG: hypothetical protein RBS07_10015 [Lentimicrobium sp.]|jgi:hypothetical protein|nr:hypothetical protein [Lentimicrobium sp.]
MNQTNVGNYREFCNLNDLGDMSEGSDLLPVEYQSKTCRETDRIAIKSILFRF